MRLGRFVLAMAKGSSPAPSGRVAVDGSHHAVHATATGMAYSKLSRAA
jgi:hypothetical protein